MKSPSVVRWRPLNRIGRLSACVAPYPKKNTVPGTGWYENNMSLRNVLLFTTADLAQDVAPQMRIGAFVRESSRRESVWSDSYCPTYRRKIERVSWYSILRRGMRRTFTVLSSVRRTYRCSL